MNTIKKIYELPLGYWNFKDKEWIAAPVPDINAHKDPEYSFEFTEGQISKYRDESTHPSIVYIKEGFGGHKYWLAHTPYPNSVGVFENPCIYYGDEDEDGNPPKLFHPISGVASGDYVMIDNPIVKVPNANQTNSDPDLFFDAENNKLCLISRNNSGGGSLYYQESIDGQSWTKRAVACIPSSDKFIPLGGLISPCVLKIGNKWRIYGLLGGASPASYKGDQYMYQTLVSKGCAIYEGTTFADGGDFELVGKISIMGKMSINPWHFDIAEYNGLYYMVFSGIDFNAGYSSQMYLAVSDDGINFKTYTTPLFNSSPYGGHYRPSISFKEDGTILLYWAEYGGASLNPDDYPDNIVHIGLCRNYANIDDVIHFMEKYSIKGWL